MYKKKTKEMVRNATNNTHIFEIYLIHNPNSNSQSSFNKKACITFHNHSSYIGYSLLNP